MKTTPIVPATLAFDDAGLPFSPEYHDIYHPRAGALAQARHVFLGGNALPARWQRRERFVVLETGFGLGHNFLATWHAWRDDPLRCARLVFISIEQHPLSQADLAAAHRASALPELAAALHQAWPPLTPNLHRLGFDDDRVQLLLALGDVHAWLPELVASVDAFYLDGFAPRVNPRMWDERVCKSLGRLAAPGATLATWSAARALRANLVTAGFDVRPGPGTGGKRDITLATYAPRFVPRRAPGRSAARAGVEPHALIVGAGLAGCSAAWALAEQGWRTTLFERQPRIAAEASGNPAGLFHGIVNAQDGVHARAYRAAALAARAAVQVAIERHGVHGSTRGLLRLESALDAAAMGALLQRLGLPPGYVQALDAREASERAGIELTHAAWYYPSGGWVEPAALARAFLERAGARVELRCDTAVAALQRSGAHWRLVDARGETIAEAATVVLANADGAFRLADGALRLADDALRLADDAFRLADDALRPADDALRPARGSAWPVEQVRGQISMLRVDASRLTPPRIPIAGAGYLLPEHEGHVVFGATTQAGDADAAVRVSDHVANLAQLERLIGRRAAIEPAELQGRTAWRSTSSDRLPLIGAVPDLAAPSLLSLQTAARLDQPRFVPRLPGLFMVTALGSRGITWCALAAQVLASTITGAPVPLEADLLDALDPARFASRRARRALHG